MISNARHASPAPAPRAQMTPAERRARRPYWLFIACVLAALAASAVLIVTTGNGHIAAGVGLTQPATEKPGDTPLLPDPSNTLRRP
jgi:hypothetical protein